MMDESGHSSLVILDESQLLIIDLEKEIRFRFGIDFNSGRDDVLGQSFKEHLISFSPDRHFKSSRRPNGVGWEFVMTDTGVQKFCVQLDGRSQLGWFVKLWRLIGDFLKGKPTAREVRG